MVYMSTLPDISFTHKFQDGGVGAILTPPPLSNQCPTALLVLAGDFNALDTDDIVSTCAFNCIVDQPTRGVNCLDKIFVSELCYANVKVVTSAVRSDHKAVIAYNGPRLPAVNKQRHRRAFRSRSPDQHVQFLWRITQLKLDFDEDADVQPASIVSITSCFICSTSFIQSSRLP